MVEKAAETGSAPPNPSLPTRHSRRWPLWLLLAVLVLVAGGAFAAWWSNSPNQSQSKTGELQEAELIVLLRPSEQNKELLDLEEAGAVPVRFGGSFSVEFRFKEPAYGYLVWLDCEGRALPLYPWNYDTLEVTDVNQPPPVRKSATVVFSPPTSGGGWKFGKKGGLETVLLLARRTPLDGGTRLGPLFETLPVPKVRHPGEVAVLGLDRGSDSVSTLRTLNRGNEDETRALDEPLKALMIRLRDHFELIRVVRFAHIEQPEPPKK